MSLIDSIGRAFDATKFHQRFDKLGRWVNARAGAKKKTGKKSTEPKRTPSPVMTEPTTPETLTPPAAETSPTSTETPPPASEAAPDFSDIQRAAGTAPTPEKLESDLSEVTTAIAAGSTPTAETIIGILQTVLVLIGEEEGVLTDGEKIILRPALNRVLKKYDVGNEALPAEVDLLVAVAGLIVSRLKKPKTAKVAAKIRAWVVNLWFGHKGREIQRVVAREASEK